MVLLHTASRGAAADLVEDAVISMGLYLQDLQDPIYQTMIERLSAPLRKHPPTVYAAGHDHALQILEGSGLADIQVGIANQSTQIFSILLRPLSPRIKFILRLTLYFGF